VSADVLERSSRDVPELASVFYGQVRAGLVDRLVQLISKRGAAGHYRVTDARILARLLIETVTTFARHIHNDVEPPGFDTAAARAVVVETLVAGIVAPPSRRT
jgi:hypothetical protein